MDFLTKEWKNGKDLALLILRVIFGLLLFYGHGLGKLTNIFGEMQFFDPIGIGATTSLILSGFAEGICALLLILGLFSRFATIFLVFNFAVVVYFHRYVNGDAFSGWEMPMLYLSAFLSLLLTGPGKYSLDYVLFGKK